MRNTVQPLRASIGRHTPMVLLLSGLALAAPASAYQTKFVTFDVPAAVYGTIASGINNLGEVTGFYIDGNNVLHGFVRTPQGAITTFDAPNASTTGYGTFGIAVNDEGVVVGDYTNADFNYGGLIRKPNGAITTYRSPLACSGGDPDGCEGSAFAAINDLNVIAGGYVDSNFVQHSLVREPGGKVVFYDAPGAGTTPGNPAVISPLENYLYQGTGVAGLTPGLNIWGAISSGFLDENYVYHGYLRSPGGAISTFDAPGAGKGYTQGTIPVGLNDLGLVTGFYLDSNNVFHGFAGTPGHHFTNLDAPGADVTDAYAGTQPEGLNDLGEITGSYLDATQVFHGFLYGPSGKFQKIDAPGADLNAGDYAGTYPSQINVFGVIAGYYVDTNFIAHGFLQIPCLAGESCQNEDHANRQSSSLQERPESMVRSFRRGIHLRQPLQ